MSSGVEDEESSVQKAEAALARGDLLAAFDAARENPDQSLRTRFLQVLALARMGDHEQAAELYERHQLAAASDVDTLSLRGRILKDQAFARAGAERTGLFRAASQAYYGVYAQSADPFPGVNAASLAWLSGDKELATRIASEIAAAPSLQSCAHYFAAVTLAEALLLLGRESEALQAVDLALALPGADPGSISSTKRQMNRMASALPGAANVAARLKPANVAMFCGHIFEEDAKREALLAREIDHILAANAIGIAYGGLAAGADLLIAERVLARGGELHVVLPFEEADFITQSVRAAGAAWLKRYADVRAKAAAVHFATHSEFVGDPHQFSYGADVAMGLTKLRARHLQSQALQIAVWDETSAGSAGTGRDVACWRAMGGKTLILNGSKLRRPRLQEREPAVSRQVRALLFTDFPNFTSISERAMPAFISEVMALAADTLGRSGTALLQKNSWGDAVFAVIRSAPEAAAIALELQSGLARLDPQKLGMSRAPTMRVSLHFGPVFKGMDPISGATGFYGTEISRAARVEPLTPAGSVYVSEPFAAVLELENHIDFTTSYVGKLQLPKGYGEHPVYALRRRASPATVD